MLDSRAFGARMTGLSLGLDSRLCGNDEMVVDGVAGMTETEALAAVAFWLSDVNRAAQKIRHRRGIADCRLPIADCRLPIADCRLPAGNGVCGQVVLVGLCHVIFLCVMPMASATDKSHYT